MDKRSFVGFQAGFAKIAKMSYLSGRERRVLFYILGAMDDDCALYPFQNEIEDALGFVQVSVSAAISSLIRAGILDELPKNGRRRAYGLNKDFAIKVK